MTDPNRHSSPDGWDEPMSYPVGPGLGTPSRHKGSAMRTVVVAMVAFGMGALSATAVLAIRENAPVAPVLASASPAQERVEATAKPLQAPQTADIALENESGISPQQPLAVAVGSDDAPPSRPIRDVMVEPNVDSAALSQDRIQSAETVVRPTFEAEPADEHAAVDPAPEPWAADRQDVRMDSRLDERPSADTGTGEVPAPGQAEPLPGIPPALTAEAGESVATPASARVKSAVSMRSGPDKGTEIVATVPADGPVQVVSCDGWCEVVYDGQRGFIYRTFLDSVP